MLTNRFSERGWRAYDIPHYLEIGYKELARLERLYDLEIYIQKSLVFVRDKYEDGK